MKDSYYGYAALVLVIAALGYSISGFFTGGSVVDTMEETRPLTSTRQGAETSSIPSVSTGTTGSGDVSVELTPHKVENGQLSVDIAVNTHSVDISQFDLKDITTLEYDGKSVKPIQAPSLQGHHASGTLIFEISKEPNSFTIKITGIPKVQERIFEW